MVEPNPIDLNKSESFSNLFNCDTQGALIYAEIAAQQIGEAIERDKAVGGGTTGGENSASRGANATGGSSATGGGTMKASGDNSVQYSGDTIEGGSENSAAEDREDATCAGGEKSLFGRIKGLFK